MSHRNRQIRYALWALAALCFGLGAANAPVPGLDRASLLLLATVFAAVTAEYSGPETCA